MTIQYTVLDYDPSWMVHDDKKMSYEIQCDGCGEQLDDDYVTIITDRSGSENAVAHQGNKNCIRMAVKGLYSDGSEVEGDGDDGAMGVGE